MPQSRRYDRRAEVRQAGLQFAGAALLAPLGLSIVADGLANHFTNSSARLIDTSGTSLGLLLPEVDRVSAWQIASGALMLLVGCILFALSLRTVERLADEEPPPPVKTALRVTPEDFPHLRTLIVTLSPPSSRPPPVAHTLYNFRSLRRVVPVVSRADHAHQVSQLAVELGLTRLTVAEPVIIDASNVSDNLTSVAALIRHRCGGDFKHTVADVTAGRVPMTITLLNVADQLAIDTLYTSAPLPSEETAVSDMVRKVKPEFTVVSPRPHRFPPPTG